MKICCAIEKYPRHPACSGGEFSAQKLFNALSKKGHEVHVVTANYDGSPVEEEENGVKIHRILSSTFGYGARGDGLRYLYRQHEGLYKHAEETFSIFLTKNRMNVIHCHSPNMIVPVNRIAKKMKLISSMMVNEQFMTCAASNKHIYKGTLCNSCFFVKTLCCNRIGRNSINRKLLATYFYLRMFRYRRCALSYDVVFCASNDVRSRLNAVGIHKTIVIFNIAEPLSCGTSFNNESPLDVKQIKARFSRVILFVASDLDDEAKGFHLIVEAARRLKEYAFICIGKYKRDSTSMFSNIFYTDRVIPAQMGRYYFLSDVVVLPSICPDALPRVGLEALALAKPLIGSNCGGIPDVIEDGVNGYLFAVGSADVLVAKLRDIFSDPQRLIAMGENSLNKAKANFSPDVVADKVITCYNRLGKI